MSPCPSSHRQPRGDDSILAEPPHENGPISSPCSSGVDKGYPHNHHHPSRMPAQPAAPHCHHGRAGGSSSHFAAQYGDRNDIALGILIAGEDEPRQQQPEAQPQPQLPHRHHEGSLLPPSLPPASALTCPAEERQERLESGQCPGCGQLLFKVKGKNSSSSSHGSRKSKFFRRRKSSGDEGGGAVAPSGVGTTTSSMVPLSVPGRVERGQCLRCCSGSSGSLQSSSNSLDLGDVSAPASALAGAASSSLLLGSGRMHQSGGSHDSSHHHHHHSHHHASGSRASAPAAVSDDSFSDNPDDCGIAVAPPSSNVSPHANVKATVATGATTVSTAPTATYQGSYNEYGERHGHGVMKWTNGDSYVGEFFNGVRHGHGSLFFADGSEYVGEWECNYMHGSGTRRFPNGDVYVGPYKDGKRSGVDGRFYFANGDLYVGPWWDDVMNGVGRYYYSHGQRFEGRFRNGKRHGPGKFQRVDGSLDQFLYLNDQRSGVGVHWSRQRTQAWKCDLSGNLKKRLTMEDAMTLAYEIDNTDC